jgi:hypothetical protein
MVILLRRMGWTGNVARMGETRNTPIILVGNPEEKIQLERLSRRGRIKLKHECVNWTHLILC